MLKQDLPYIYVYNAQFTEFDVEDDKYDSLYRYLDEEKFQMDLLKQTIIEQNVDVLVLRLLERVSIHYILRSTHLILINGVNKSFLVHPTFVAPFMMIS